MLLKHFVCLWLKNYIEVLWLKSLGLTQKGKEDLTYYVGQRSMQLHWYYFSVKFGKDSNNLSDQQVDM